MGGGGVLMREAPLQPYILNPEPQVINPESELVMLPHGPFVLHPIPTRSTICPIPGTLNTTRPARLRAKAELAVFLVGPSAPALSRGEQMLKSGTDPESCTVVHKHTIF